MFHPVATRGFPSISAGGREISTCKDQMRSAEIAPWTPCFILHLKTLIPRFYLSKPASTCVIWIHVWVAEQRLKSLSSGTRSDHIRAGITPLWSISRVYFSAVRPRISTVCVYLLQSCPLWIFGWSPELCEIFQQQLPCSTPWLKNQAATPARQTELHV